MRKPVVGEALYSLNVGNAARSVEQKLTKVIVTKVGRKYFTCIKEEYIGTSFADMGIEYHLDSWWEKTECIASSALYENEQEWVDEVETGKICKKVYEAFEYGKNKKELSLVDLRKIADILNLEI